MKERYRAWASLTASSARPGSIRLIDFPGMRDLEAVKHLNDVARVREDFQLNDRIDEFSRRHFGITEQDTRYVLPENIEQLRRVDPEKAYDLEDEQYKYEEQFFCRPSETVDDQCAYLLALGWDMRDDSGQPMRLFERFARQIEAAVKGLVEGTRLPDLQAIRSANWETKLTEDARKYMSRKRSS